MMDERENYLTIKTWFLECVFDTCRNHWGDETWPYGSVISFTYEEFSVSYDSPIEILMLNVIAFIMSGGWDSGQANYYNKQIDDLLSINDLGEMLANIPKEEADEFLQDMRILKLID